MTTYSESAEGVTITKARAIQELRRHGHTIDRETLEDFHAECGDHDAYQASDVLAFLGY